MQRVDRTKRTPNTILYVLARPNANTSCVVPLESLSLVYCARMRHAPPTNRTHEKNKLPSSRSTSANASSTEVFSTAVADHSHRSLHTYGFNWDGISHLSRVPSHRKKFIYPSKRIHLSRTGLTGRAQPAHGNPTYPDPHLAATE